MDTIRKKTAEMFYHLYTDTAIISIHPWLVQKKGDGNEEWKEKFWFHQTVIFSKLSYI